MSMHTTPRPLPSAVRKAGPKSATKGLADLLPKDEGKAKPEVLVDQGLVDAFLSAEANVAESAVALFLACTVHKVSPDQFKGRKDGKVRASEFNSANRCAAAAKSAQAARDIINTACKQPGDKRHNVLAALRKAIAVYAEVKPLALKGAALAKKVAKQVEAATVEASKADAKRQAKRKAERATRTPALPKGGTLEAFMPAALAALVDVQKRFAGLTIPKGKLRAAENFTDSLAETIKLAGELNA